MKLTRGLCDANLKFVEVLILVFQCRGFKDACYYYSILGGTYFLTDFLPSQKTETGLFKQSLEDLFHHYYNLYNAEGLFNRTEMT